MNILIFFILGLLASLLYPPYFFAPLGFLIFPIICILIEKNKKNFRKIDLFNYSFSFSFTLLLSFLFWIQNPFFVFEETKNLFLLFILLIILLSFIFSLIFTLIVGYNNFIPTVFLIPLVFVIYECVISIIFTGFPWITFSLILSNTDIFLFIIKHFGTIISSYITIQLFCMPFIFFTENNKIKNLCFAIFIILPLVISFSFNHFYVDIKNNINKKINLEIFQLNHKINTNTQDLEIRLREIIELISNSDAELLIFGENNYPYTIKDQEINFIQSFLKKNQKLIIGGTRNDQGNYFNTLIHMSKKNIFYFDKKILVPFGEYLPLRKYLLFLEPISGLYDFFVGKKNRLINFDNDISYIPVICYEILFYCRIYYL